MPRALDHIVWPARDLDALADLFNRLGFTVGRRNRHPWGTVNHIVQFDGMFLELLGFAEDYAAVPAKDPAFPFAGFCERYVARHDAGAAMLVLRSHDATADAALLQSEGLGGGRLLPFSRAVQGPDGSDRTVAFTIAFAELPGLPEVGAFLCEQHRPENFWNPAAQRHANGALGVTTMTVQGPDPQSHASVLRRFVRDETEGTAGQILLEGDSRIAVTPSREGDAPGIASIDLRVGDLSFLTTALRSSGLAWTFENGGLVVTSPVLGRTSLRFHET